jgi:ribosomal 30S subunit maturation factor RimM
MSCAYCITKQHYLLVIKTADGGYHVHAPFQDKKVMKEIKKEIGKAEKKWKPTK